MTKFQTRRADIDQAIAVEITRQGRFFLAMTIWLVGALAIVAAGAVSMPRVERVYQEGRV